ncbi:MAG: NADH-quinone oxidoreductase subunit NuoK [Thiotrichales bacterium]|nr:MAG: NADH-quinone oxidoreductase subunit NuoK [Thiotrichales bacterium]
MTYMGDYLFLGAVLFGISIAGIILNKKNLIVLLMSIEIMLLAVNTNFVAFAAFNQDVVGEIFVFFVLTVAAAEAAIGLAILVILFKQKKSIDIADINQLRG